MNKIFGNLKEFESELKSFLKIKISEEIFYNFYLINENNIKTFKSNVYILL